MSLVEQELFTLQKHMSSPPFVMCSCYSIFSVCCFADHYLSLFFWLFYIVLYVPLWIAASILCFGTFNLFFVIFHEHIETINPRNSDIDTSEYINSIVH